MSKEKQIIEIKECIDAVYGADCAYYDVDGFAIANEIYNAGYRKQRVGEWQIKSEIYKLIDDVDEELYVECPFCKRRFPVPYEFDDEKIFKYAREHYPYCNCGAKMKGGAE